MALVVANRVQETTTTAGTGTITLAGASAGYQSFAVIGNGNTTYYTIVDGNNWEVGIGTYTASGTTLSRDTVLSSSASGAKITLSGNIARVFVDYPAEKAIYQDSSGNVGIGIAPTQKLTAAGVIESTTGGFKFPDGTTQTSAVSASGITYITKTGNYTAANNQGILANTTGGAFTVTLPSSPSAGAQVIVADAGNTWGTNNLTVGRNGSTIEGLAEDLICNITGVSVQLVYSGTTWEVYAQVGGAGGTGVLGVINGGTGASTLTGYVKGNGTAAFTASATISGSDISGNISGNAANVTGTVAIANGGTNGTAAPTAGAVAYGTGSAYAFTSAGTSGQVLTSNGASAPTWGAAPTGVAANPRTLLTTKTIAYGVTPTQFLGSVNLSATTQMLFVADSTNIYASVYDSSTDTMGSAVSVGTVAGGLGISKISSTAVLIGYASSTETFSARVLSVSGTTLTANTAATAATCCTTVNGDPAVIGSTYVFAMTYATGTACNLIAATVSGTTVTLGSSTLVSNTATTTVRYRPAVTYSATTGFVVYHDSLLNQLSYRGFSISGTTVTLSGTTLAGPASDCNTVAYHTLSNGKIMLIHTGATLNFSYALVSMSGSTVTLSFAEPATITTNATAGMYSVVNGTSVLLIATAAAATSNTTANAIVVRDNSGTIAVSSATQVTSGIGMSIIPASATTIMIAGPNSSGASYSSIVSIVSNAPSVATTVNSVSQSSGIVTNFPFGACYTSIALTNSAFNFSYTLAGGNFYRDVVLGTSGNYYRTFNESLSYSPNPSTVTTKIYMPNYVAANSRIDTTITGGCWHVTFGTNTLLYRVQYA